MDALVVRRCRSIATATWSDALDSLGISGVMDGIAMRSGNERVAGPAVTVAEQTAEVGAYELEQFDIGGILRAPAGSVPVIDMGGAEVSTFGGLAARGAADRKIAGIVIDGGCRDLAEIRASGIYLASRYVTPRSGKRRVNVLAIGAPITCGGVAVHPGDCVIADETGIVVVPRTQLLEALAVAEKITGNDRAFEGELAAGIAFGNIASRLGHL